MGVLLEFDHRPGRQLCLGCDVADFADGLKNNAAAFGRLVSGQAPCISGSTGAFGHDRDGYGQFFDGGRYLACGLALGDGCLGNLIR